MGSWIQSLSFELRTTLPEMNRIIWYWDPHQQHLKKFIDELLSNNCIRYIFYNLFHVKLTPNVYKTLIQASHMPHHVIVYSDQPPDLLNYLHLKWDVRLLRAHEILTVRFITEKMLAWLDSYMYLTWSSPQDAMNVLNNLIRRDHPSWNEPYNL